jgi:uncharacterized protein YcbX
MNVAKLWRYPVKSMAGERLDRATIGPLGIKGDRMVQVENARGRFVTARSHPKLLGHRAALDASGEPLVDGVPWNDPRVLRQVIEIAGEGAKLVRDESARRFDILPLLVATDGAIAAFAHDGRRLRPNIVVGGVEGLAERTWPGLALKIGEVLIGIQDLRGRCIMTTYDPDTIEQDREVLHEIMEKFDGTMALNCYVIRGGEIAVGDKVELIDRPASPRDP